MKRRLAPANLAMHLHRPLRFGPRWRGHELPLRIIQLIVIAWLAFAGVRWIGHALALGTRALAGMVS